MRHDIRVLLGSCMTAALLAGCSNDGGFFPGTLSHNEGVVDYRVAPITPLGIPKSVDGSMMIPLGESQRKPYQALESSDTLHVVERAPVQPQVAEADERVARLNDIVRSKREQISVQELTVDVREKDVRSAETKKSKNDEDINRLTDELARLKDDNNTETKSLNAEERERRIAEASTKRESAASQAALFESALFEATSKRDEEKAHLESARRGLEQATKGLEQAIKDRDVAVKSVQQAIAKGEVATDRIETIRVTLKQAYMRRFAEAGPVCEVAILMTVKETRNGIGQSEPKSGRVVYYSEGVRKNAFMNFRDQPVYGPIRYNGDDVQIRISIIELDEKDNATAGSMLKTIASLGSVAFPPSSPVLAALDQIGASLLTLNGPDLEWDYLMRLSSRAPSLAGREPPKYIDAWLRDGYYVLMRSDVTVSGPKRARITDDEWNHLFLDAQSGVVYQNIGTDQSPKYKEYQDRSYLVFAVQSGFDSSQLDLAQETAELSAVLGSYGSASDSVSAAAEAMTKSLQKSLESARQMKEERQRMRRNSTAGQ